LLGQLLVDEPAVDLDVVALGIGFAAKYRNQLSIDGNFAVDDHLFGGAARRNAAAGDEFLQSFFHFIFRETVKSWFELPPQRPRCFSGWS
jgi:hypothetical protein